LESEVLFMAQPYTPSPEQFIDQEVRHSLRVIQRQRTVKFVGVFAVTVLAAFLLLLTTYLGLTR